MVVPRFALGVWLCVHPVAAQISAGGTPPSFTQTLAATVPTVPMTAVDNQAQLTLDQQAGKDAPYRFAEQLDVSLNLRNSGAWTSLANGDRIWRLRISSPGAFSIGLIYNDWFIPKGGQLYLYNDDHSRVIGAFTSFNNWNGTTNTTQHVAGDATTLEYLEPAAIRGQSRLAIFKVCHAYRNLFGMSAITNYGDSGPCEINVNCPVASGWQNQKRGVAMLVINNSGGCSGSLVNNTNNDYTPYFLTAHHCTGSFSDSYILYFNYESPNCSNINGPLNQTVANGYLDATYINSDFSLIGFSSAIPINYGPYFNGWSNVNSPSTNSTCIHHPELDIKKISHDNNAPGSYGWNAAGDTHWHIFQWDQFGSTVGVTEPGSSGSPLFDQNQLITGQLHGGASYCGYPYDDYYGKVAYSWNGGGTNSSRLSNWLDPANTGASTWDGLNAVVAGNDICPGYYIWGLPYSTTGNTSLANNDYTHYIYGNSPDVVYTVPGLNCDMSVTISLCGSSFDTGVEVRTGGSCPGTTLVTYNDDNYCGTPFTLQSTATFTASAATTYYILVYGYASYSGPFTMNVTGTPTAPVPANDVCPGPTISSLPYSNSGSTCTAAANYTSCVTTPSPDVVYTLNIPSCQTVTVSLCGSNFDTQLSVYANGSCPGTYLVACNDDYCGLQSQASFIAQANTNYYILVSGWAGNVGNYVINVTGTPFTTPNDACPGTTIAGLPYSDVGNTACANNEGYPHCGGSNAPDVVYNYTPSSCQVVTASLCGTAYDTRIDVRAGGSCPGSLLIACNDDFCGLQSQVTFNAYAGVTYYVIVSGFSNNSGAYVLNVSSSGGFTPPNDVCPGTTIATLPYTDIGSTTCDAHNYPNFQGNSSPDAVYNLTSASCRSVTVTLCGSGYDTGISVYRNGACPGTTLVAGNDDNLCAGVGTLQSTVGFQASVGITYYILVHGYSTASGPYILNVTGQPCNVTAAVDSLVILPFSPHIYLQWSYQGPAYYFNIYRATTPNVPIVPANKIDSTTSYAYYDINILNNPATRFFYAVTAASLPTFLSEGGNTPDGVTIDKATASATSEPWFAAGLNSETSQPDIAKTSAAPTEPVFLPAYEQFSTHYVPNPNKQAMNPAK